MFSKATKTSEVTQAPHRKPLAASLIVEGMTILGDLSAAGDLHLDGTVEGDVTVGCLTLGETGLITGAVHADTVEVRGRVRGSIAARQVRLCATAHVDGDISHSELAIEPGAHFEGRSTVLVEPAAVEPLSVAAE